MVVLLIDLPLEIALQLMLQSSPVLLVAATLTDLMVIGMLLTVYDEVRIDTAAFGLPPDHALPKTAQGAYNLGVEYSQVGHWYFAAQLWQRAVALQHVEGRYRRALGTAYLRLGEVAAAKGEIHAARWLMPDDEQTSKLLATLDRTPQRGS
jgi:tetratricopeptide (TPR) repeat protein